MQISQTVIARNEAISELCQSGKWMLCVLFCLFLSAEALAQNRDTTHTDSVRKFIIVDARTPSKSDKPLIVVDDKIYKRGFKSIDTNNIVNIEILKGKEAKTQFGEKGRNGVVVIVTKKYAIQQYQKKFSTFSKEYKDYLEHHQDNGENISYLLNGAFFSVKSGDSIKQLYDIPADKIKAIVFAENQFYNGGDSRPYIVAITTK